MAGQGWVGLICWALLGAPVAPQPSSPVPGAFLTTLAPRPQSEASMLSLNLGLNFKFHVRGPGSAWGGLATETQPRIQVLDQEPNELGGGLRTDPLPELSMSSPEWGSAEGSAVASTSTLPLQSTSPDPGPRDGLPLLGTLSLDPMFQATAPPPSTPWPHKSEVELKFDVALRAGAAPTLGQKMLPLLPSLRASLAEIAGRLGPFGFFGTTLSSQLEPLEANLTNSTVGPGSPHSDGSIGTEPPDITPMPSDPSPTGPRSSSAQPECGAEACGPLDLPEPDDPPPAAPMPPFFLNLEADWASARARWGLAWEAHVYGVGALFGLVALLALLSLALLPWRCPPGAPCLALLNLLLLSAGAARAFPLFYDAYGHRERLPGLVRLLLHDLSLPCLTACLGLACLLLARPRPPRCPGGLATLLLLVLGLSAGATMAGAVSRPLLPLLLASRGLAALLASLFSGLLLALSCRSSRRRAGVPLGGPGLKGPTPIPPIRGPFALPQSWQWAARTAPVAGAFGLLSGGLQGYLVLYTLGYGGQLGLAGPWPWWAFQLGVRLGEVGVALPLALLGLYPALYSPRISQRCWAKLFRLSPGHGAPLLPSGWGPRPQDKLPPGSTMEQGEAELLPLCALAGPGPDLLLPGGGHLGMEGGAAHLAPSAASSRAPSDCTVDFCPPSPIDLHRSIAEALCSEVLITPSFFQGPVFRETLPGPSLSGTTSSEESSGTGTNEANGGDPSSPAPVLPSPGAWLVGSSASSGSLYGLSRDSSSMLLCSSPEKPPRPPLAGIRSTPRPSGSSSSPPAPGCYRALSLPSCTSPERPELSKDEALLQEQFLDACRQIDELSVSSETIDL
ncbi:LOW QUALITY PROTEIN: proline-rich transmembrane protein 4 [Monodelphis domestica]|uniref:LOW QUALITY PROTEIN: proline-rich transmembrane protein 4 n=1 Tax=Monodelphis domestica TaxID=13616 RepID=UPI0024E1BA12|nr:LOW QUALITY PROTEIN: proline-rich transmembrane protein 4 [Monodelphis domestica]